MQQLTIEDYEKLRPQCEIIHNGVKMIFSTPSSLTLWRVKTIYEKEPCTLEWISTFKENECFLDVGANVGMYSIWAAVTRKVKVFSFEPESTNYSLLNRNIFLNNQTDNIKAICCALSNKNEITNFYIQDLSAGSSNSAAGEALNFELKPMDVKFSQGCITFKLDDLVNEKKIEIPHHIKIDVDGFEHKVIEGAKNTLHNSKIKSVLIELNPCLSEHRETIDSMIKMGFKYDLKQVKNAERKNGPFKGLAEYVFRR